MHTRFAHLIRLACLMSLFLVGCAAGRIQPSNETASRILTAVATRATATRQAMMSGDATAPNVEASPTPTEPTATPQPPMVFARCIMRAEIPMRQQPEDGAQVTASLQPRDIVTAYGRTADGQWILAWNREIAFGWIPSGNLGCSAPFEDLRLTEPDILLTPRPTATPTHMATAMTETPAADTTPTPELTPTATAEPALGVTETSIPTAMATEPTATATTMAAALPTPTVEATATMTPTPEPVTPTATAAVTEAPAESLSCVVAITQALNLRAGPDRTARWLGQIRPGARFSATGRNADATWLYGTTARGDLAWVIASALRCDGDPSGLPVVNGS